MLLECTPLVDDIYQGIILKNLWSMETILKFDEIDLTLAGAGARLPRSSFEKSLPNWKMLGMIIMVPGKLEDLNRSWPD